MKDGYKKNYSLKNICCKYGKITDPVGLLDSMKDGEWEYERVRRNYEMFRQRRKEKRERKESYKKYTSWDEPLRKELEQELNEYGKKYGIKTHIEHVKSWKDEWYEIKGYFGVFYEWAEFRGTLKELKSVLKELIRDSRNPPEHVKKEYEEDMMWLELEEC